jgi:hypothetical protein
MKNNPKLHPSWQIEKIVQSIQNARSVEPKLLQTICVDENMVVLIGNGRTIGIRQLGWKKVEVNVIEGLTEDEKMQLAILDNKSISLEWDEDLLAKALPKLSDKGLETGFSEKEIMDIVAKTTELPDETTPTYEMSPRLYEKYNYILLFFRNEIDFLYASQLFQLKKMSDRMKPQKVGLYRCIEGMDAIKKIKESKDEIPHTEPEASEKDPASG